MSAASLALVFNREGRDKTRGFTCLRLRVLALNSIPLTKKLAKEVRSRRRTMPMPMAMGGRSRSVGWTKHAEYASSRAYTRVRVHAGRFTSLSIFYSPVVYLLENYIMCCSRR